MYSNINTKLIFFSAIALVTIVKHAKIGINFPNYSTHPCRQTERPLQMIYFHPIPEMGLQIVITPKYTLEHTHKLADSYNQKHTLNDRCMGPSITSTSKIYWWEVLSGDFGAHFKYNRFEVRKHVISLRTRVSIFIPSGFFSLLSSPLPNLGPEYFKL